MTRQRNDYGARVGASGFRLSDNAPESGNVGRTPRRDGDVVLVFECASCRYYAGDVGLPIERRSPGLDAEGTDSFNTPWYQDSRSVGEVLLDDDTPHALWPHCIRCKGKAGYPREVLRNGKKISEALQELRRRHLEEGAQRVVRYRF